MRLPPMAVKRPSRSPLTISVLIFSALCSALPAAAQTTGVIAFRDDCTHLLYAMRGDGSGRTALQLPPLPGPADQYEYRDPWVLDVTTRGPLSIVYYVGIVAQGSSTLEDSSGLYAVEVSEVGGSLLVRRGCSSCPTRRASRTSPLVRFPRPQSDWRLWHLPWHPPGKPAGYS
jgi:hypothetical protein